MKAGGGKRKGASFEIYMAEQLSLWVSSGQNEDLFWRSAMSGGRATLGLRKQKTHKHQAGDLSPISVMGEEFTNLFYIECKFYAKLHYQSLLFGRPVKGTVLEFFQIAAKEAKKYNKSPFLIVKQNRTRILVLTDTQGLSLLNFRLQTPVPGYTVIGHLGKKQIILFFWETLCSLNWVLAKGQPTYE